MIQLFPYSVINLMDHKATEQFSGKKDVVYRMLTVKSLRAEVESLKSSIGSSNGQGGSGSSSSTSGEFKVDDLWFSRGGGVASPLKSLTYEGGDSNVYSYDKYGRLVKQEGSSSVLSYSYEGKKVYLTQKIINIDGSSNSFNIVYEYN